MAITEWSTVTEPVPDTDYQVPSAVTDIDIALPTKGIVLVTPNGLSLYRVFVDFDGAIATEYVNAFSGTIPDTTPAVVPYPVFGDCEGDLMILSAGKGIVFPVAPTATVPRFFYRLRIDTDGTLVTETTTLASWWRIYEVNIALFGIDSNRNWIFSKDLAIVTPGQGIVMPCRGGAGTRRLRVDNDGTIISE